MNSIKKIISIILVILFIVASVSCTSEKDDKNETKGSNPVTKGEESPDLPDFKFDGEKVKFMVRGEGDGNEWDCIDVFSNEKTDRVADEILKRNMKVEDKYGITIEQECYSVNYIGDLIRDMSRSGDQFCDVIVNSEYGLYNAAVEGNLCDMNSLLYNDFSKSWWDTELNKDLTLANHRFFAVSSMNLMSYYATWIVAFNFEIFQDLGLDINVLYQLVRDGGWTIDKYKEYQTNYTKDIDLDGKMTDMDQWGTAGQSDHILGMLYGIGFSVLKKNSDDLPQLQTPSKKVYDAITKVMELCNKSNAFDSHDASVNQQYSTNGEYGRAMFADNRAMFFHETLEAVAQLRDMNGDFGVIPVPKLDESQKKYISMVHYWAMSMNAIPSWSISKDKASVILEAMAYYSQKDVVPEFLSSAVYGKYLRDDASYEMLDYVNENRFVDFGIVTNIGGIIGVVKSGVYDGTLNYPRIIDSVKTGVAQEMEDLADTLLGLEVK